MAEKKVYRVKYMKSEGQWRLKADQNQRYTGMFDKKSEAVDRGKELAQKAKGDLVVLKQDGKVQSRFSYVDE